MHIKYVRHNEASVDGWEDLRMVRNLYCPESERPTMVNDDVVKLAVEGSTELAENVCVCECWGNTCLVPRTRIPQIEKLSCIPVYKSIESDLQPHGLAFLVYFCFGAPLALGSIFVEREHPGTEATFLIVSEELLYDDSYIVQRVNLCKVRIVGGGQLERGLNLLEPIS